jgi:7,8-dihydropterin-6-yl-methyl-4-(beta-D-ribofuranosyl)aminobenzene 5'-phosphate synthase
VLRLTLLVDDLAAGRGLIAEHGFALWIEHDDRKYLFDTGQGQALEHNAKHLGIKLNEMDAILLSHGHYDHTGALAAAVDLTPGVRICVHPDALRAKYALTKAGTSQFIGTPEAVVSHVRARARLEWIEVPTPLDGGLNLTGPIPRITEFEDTGGPFFRDALCETPDELTDDQAVYVETRYGLVVILGCGHAGVVNTLRYVQKLTGNAFIHTVIGGMHLLSAASGRIDQTIAALADLGVRRLIPLHCTGFRAVARFWQELPVQMTMCSIGTTLEYD